MQSDVFCIKTAQHVCPEIGIEAMQPHPKPESLQPATPTPQSGFSIVKSLHAHYFSPEVWPEWRQATAKSAETPRSTIPSILSLGVLGHRGALTHIGLPHSALIGRNHPIKTQYTKSDSSLTRTKSLQLDFFMRISLWRVDKWNTCTPLAWVKISLEQKLICGTFYPIARAQRPRTIIGASKTANSSRKWASLLYYSIQGKYLTFATLAVRAL